MPTPPPTPTNYPVEAEEGEALTEPVVDESNGLEPMRPTDRVEAVETDGYGHQTATVVREGRLVRVSGDP